MKIMYIHVPSAWLSMACYSIIALSSAGYLIWRHPLADVSAKAAAPIGAVFTLLALVTGSLWGKPMWGAYWVWDARLTSVLILFFLYLGLIALRQAIDEPGRAGRAAAILSLIGAVNIPIIKYSVNWWNTLHQPASVIRADGPTIAPSLLWPLLVMAIAFTVAVRRAASEGHARRGATAQMRRLDRGSRSGQRGSGERGKEQRYPMFDLGPHAGFICISYAAVLLGVAGLTLWVWTDESAQKRRLADLERRGMRRRSSQQEGTDKS